MAERYAGGRRFEPRFREYGGGVGRATSLRTGSGRMVMQAIADFFVGGSNPGAVNTAAAPPRAAAH